MRGDAALPYKIDFENDPSATAPAQVVTVSDILSPSFDLDTFELTGIKFGDVVLTPPPGSQYYATTVPMTQNGTTFNVLVEAGLHTTTREVFATFQSIDPETSLPPEVTLGFLPPEPAHVSDPVAEAATPGRGQGQGQITYSIKSLAGLPTGTKITNVAKIIFDENASIATDQVNPHDASAGSDPSKQALLTIINGLPKSHVIALTPKENDSFMVKWTGDDGLGGASLAKFDVYASDDGGQFTAWQTGLAASSAVYSGAVAGHTYAFYTVATDYVGQVESKTAAAETQTTISANPWQNAEKTPDVDDDGTAAPKDLTAIILQLNGFAPDLPQAKPAGDFFYDVDGDHQVTPSDLVKVIIFLNSFGAGEGEAAARPIADSLLDSVPASLATSEPAAAATGAGLSSNDLLTMLATDLATTSRRRPT